MKAPSSHCEHLMAKAGFYTYLKTLAESIPQQPLRDVVEQMLSWMEVSGKAHPWVIFSFTWALFIFWILLWHVSFVQQLIISLSSPKLLPELHYWCIHAQLWPLAPRSFSRYLKLAFIKTLPNLLFPSYYCYYSSHIISLPNLLHFPNTLYQDW